MSAKRRRVQQREHFATDIFGQRKKKFPDNGLMRRQYFLVAGVPLCYAHSLPPPKFRFWPIAVA